MASSSVVCNEKLPELVGIHIQTYYTKEEVAIHLQFSERCESILCVPIA